MSKCSLFIILSQVIFAEREHILNSLRFGENGQRFADDILKCVCLNEYIAISDKISLKCVNVYFIMSTLLLVMAWCCQATTTA